MTVTAVLDVRHLRGEWGLHRKAAGLTLVERALRMVWVNGAYDVVIWASDANLADVKAQVATAQVSLSPIVVTEFNAVKAAVGVSETILVLDAATVFHRGMVKDLTSGFDGQASVIRLNTNELAALALIPRGTLTSFSSVQEFAAGLGAREIHDDRWQVTIHELADLKRAERSLWLDCRKPLDGMVSRHINRYMSLFISRLLASTPIKPNHISVFTFSLGILAGVLASLGGFQNFLLAGLVFQLNSVIDGCDGELARVRYQFSVLGEWLDTLSDDFSDVFFWAGLGWGASKTFGGVFGLSPEVWLWLGVVAVAGKLLSMVVYYRWLIANKRGDLLAFTWSFDSADEESTWLDAILKNLKYFAKKDFIVFAAMLLGILGWLPWILVAMAPGNLIVALGVVLEQAKGRGTT
jgi:phosphatidylglycerophosphate synthase